MYGPSGPPRERRQGLHESVCNALLSHHHKLLAISVCHLFAPLLRCATMLPATRLSGRRRARCRARAARRSRPRPARHSRPSCDRGSAPARRRRAVDAVSGGARQPAQTGAPVARHRTAVYASGRDDRARAGRPSYRRDHADRVGQDAVLQRPGPARDSPGSVEPGAVSLPDESARAGSARRAPGDVRHDRPRRGRADWRLHLRWRYAAGRAPDDPVARAPGAQQPRHGALGHPAAPSAVGEAVREPALRDHRRAARLSRRVRQPSLQRAAAAAADLPALRVEPGVSLLVGDDREPARAGRAADGTAVRAGGQERRAARREVLRVRQPAGRQSPAGHPPFVPERDAARRRRSS